MRISRLLLLLPLLAPLPLLAQPASVVRDSELKAEPFADAKTIAMLKSKQTIEVGARKGGWYQAKGSDGTSGWVRLTAVLLGGATQSRGDSGLAATAQFLQTGRSGSSGVTAATGVRGLDAADVVNATPNSPAVAKLDGQAISHKESWRFAKEGELKPQPIAYLPEEK